MTKPAEEIMRTAEEWQDYVAKELREGAERMDKLQAELTANTKLTAEFVDVFTACKGGFRVLGWLGTLVKWAGLLATGIVACVVAYKKAVTGWI